MDKKRKTGIWGEVFAVRYLRDKGYEIVDINFRVGHLEADILAAENDILCIVEVKTRSGETMLPPAENVGAKKRWDLQTIGAAALRLFPEYRDVRYDVIEVFYKTRTDYRIHHIKNAF